MSIFSLANNTSNTCTVELLPNVFSFIGDQKTLGSLFKTSHRIREQIIAIQKNRIRCFHLLEVIKKLDRDVRSFYEGAKERGIHVKEYDSENSSVYSDDSEELLFQLENVNDDVSFEDGFKSNECGIDQENTEILTCSTTLRSLIRERHDKRDMEFIDMRINSEFLRKYLSRAESEPYTLLEHIFMHLKEDVVDALSQQPEQVINSLSVETYPSELILSDCEVVNRSIFCLDNIMLEAKKREAGVVSVWPARAEVGMCYTKNGFLQYSDVKEEEQTLIQLVIDTTHLNNLSEKKLNRKFRNEFSNLEKAYPLSLVAGMDEGDALFFIMKEHTCRLRVLLSNDYRERFSTLSMLLMELVKPSDDNLPEIEVSDSISFLSYEEQREIKTAAYSKLLNEMRREKELSQLVTRRSFIESVKVEEHKELEVDTIDTEIDSADREMGHTTTVPYGRDLTYNLTKNGCIIS